MEPGYKKQILNRILTRAETGLYFLEDFLYDHSAEDGAYFRSLCILLSYSVELILKAKVVLLLDSSTKEDLETKLKALNHNIDLVAEKLGPLELDSIGIKSIAKRSTGSFLGYVIHTTDNKEIQIENFIDIRYDFLNDGLRDLPDDSEFKMWVLEALSISKRVRSLYT